MLIALLAFHILVATAVGLLGRWLGPKVFLVAALAPLSTAIAAGWLEFTGATPHSEVMPWAGGLDLTLSFRVDAFSLVFLALIGGIGALIFVYSAWYFGRRSDIGQVAATMVVFAMAMAGVASADNLVALYVFWELTSVCSYLLIGMDDRKQPARAAALQALLVTALGGLVMLAGFVILAGQSGTWLLSGVLTAAPGGPIAAVGVALVLVGAFTKSAQAPFHFWLPGAMAAPTPVSAYLHSATMVKAGVFLVARMAPAFATVHAFWRPLLLTVGVVTMLLGGWKALRQHDLKLLLAHGTVSQLGMLVAVFGAGVPELTMAGVTLLVAHACFKATLFMVVGVVDHSAGCRDLRFLRGVGKALPVVALAGALSSASMAGLPPLVGFISKEAVYEGFLHGAEHGLGPLGYAALAGVIAGSVLTFAYGWRLVGGMFGWGAKQPLSGSSLELPEEKPDAHVHHSPGVGLVLPLLVLTVATVLFGLFPSLLGRTVVPAAVALDASVGGYLALWHGFNLPLGLSVGTVALGAALVLAAPLVQKVVRRRGEQLGPLVYRYAVRGLQGVAIRVASITQSGSLPVYLLVILTAVVGTPAVVVLAGGGVALRPPDGPVPWLEVFAALVIAVSAVTVLRSRRRFGAVLALGAVGTGITVLYLAIGAPDLALTQLMVEILSVAVFMLVLRHLPDWFRPDRYLPGRFLRVAVALLVGTVMTVLTLVTVGARTGATIAEEFLARSLSEGGGRNVVNVILVDFRGFDTMGEIAVLMVCGLGIASLVAAGRLAGTPHSVPLDGESEEQVGGEPK